MRSSSMDAGIKTFTIDTKKSLAEIEKPHFDQKQKNENTFPQGRYQGKSPVDHHRDLRSG